MTQSASANLMDKIVALCKRRGFIFQSSEIYGGLNGFWDYGPAGAELKRNIKDAWWTDIVRRRTDVVGIDGTIITHPRVWEASGHTTAFTDPMVDCRDCKKRYRADQLCEELGLKLVMETGSAAEKKIRLPPNATCPACGSKNLTEPRPFNLMFKTFVGPVEDESNVTYLRPETAQVIFTQFQNVLSVSRQKVPFGIAQIGKAFRNEINPRNFTFRSREFEQMELEFFIKPGTDAEWHRYWVNERLKWYETIGLPRDKLSVYEYKPDELAHYASACVDVMFAFPFGVQELEGIAARGDFDLRQHQQFSGKSMEYFDDETKERYIPHVVEPSAGVDRIALALICAAYTEEEVEPGDTRVVMKFAPRIAPIKVAVFPLLRNKPALVEKARQVFELLQPHFATEWDDRGNIGKRYRYQDEQGTPWCVTIDFETLGEKGPALRDTVTVRDRDSMKQERVPISDLVALFTSRLRA
ncbi:MAG: glycine--tRNA ligase [Verrucomicrobiae bacterium]|nr:glycine--tRNA ligase [Verrucomicrobiae bacterium]